MTPLDHTMGLYGWAFGIHDDSYIHPDDLERFAKIAYLRVFEYVGQTAEYLILRHDQQEYRVKPDLYVVVPRLAFTYGDMVETITGTKRVGTIRDIIWHTVKNSPMFFIRVGSTKISKRYWESDLILIR